MSAKNIVKKGHIYNLFIISVEWYLVVLIVLHLDAVMANYCKYLNKKAILFPKFPLNFYNQIVCT